MKSSSAQNQGRPFHWFIQALIWLIAIPIIILASPFIAFSVVQFHYRKRQFFKRYRGAVFVVANPYHGWRDFIANNVLLVLPSPEFLICRLYRKSGEQSHFITELLNGLRPWPSKPFAVQVNSNRLVLIPLNGSLLPLKRLTRAKSEAAQRQIRELLEPTRP